ncbi:hypothetical protein CSOJ01_15509 [Colletotrichum sojae]|uniref:Uncharacterized protein n=1 Tax=Colletotrichum sojae TaxID=2175907 RepID=A0A8H6MHN6_9PEZI|nr:hypothetical protein CSOJ01_15509 [Colletotrichum sojae]
MVGGKRPDEEIRTWDWIDFQTRIIMAFNPETKRRRRVAKIPSSGPEADSDPAGPAWTSQASRRRMSRRFVSFSFVRSLMATPGAGTWHRPVKRYVCCLIARPYSGL